VKKLRLQIADPGLSSLKSAARAGIVMPAVFALADKVIGQPQVALFAAFGSFAMLVLVSFSGPARSRLIAYLTLAVAGAALVALGTLCSRNAWLAAGAMAVVGFLILFSGVINGYFAAGGTGAVLAFVLAVAVPAPVSAIGDRLAGWALASGAGILAVMLLWPPRTRGSLRADAGRACLALAALADVLCGDQSAVAARTAAAREAVDGLRDRLTASQHRPTGPTGPAAALSALVDELGWLFGSLSALAASPAGELCPDENSTSLRAAAAVLRASGAQLAGRPDEVAGQPSIQPGLSQAGAPRDGEPGGRLETAQEAATQLLTWRISEVPQIPDDQSLEALLGRSFRVHAISYTTRQIAGYAQAATGVATPRPADPVARAAAAGQPAQAGRPGNTGPLGAPDRWMGWARSLLQVAEDYTVTHAGVRSVWFRNSVRGAVGLAIAVFIAQKSGLQHSFWVVLGTLSVLRSNALGTGRSVLSALAGTAVGIVIGAAILIPVGTHDTVLWGVLPVAVLIAAYAPQVISFAAGQAAFTVVIVVLFNIIQPAGWKVGILRIEDVAVGFAISLGVGLVFWPRGAAAVLRENLAAAYSRSADYVAAMVEQLTGVDGGADPDRAGVAAAAAVHRLDDSFSQYLRERSAKRVDPERAARLVAGAGRVLRAGRSMADLHEMALRQQADTQERAIQQAAIPPPSDQDRAAHEPASGGSTQQGPSAPEPSAPEPSTQGPSTPGPGTQEMATQGPAAQEVAGQPVAGQPPADRQAGRQLLNGRKPCSEKLDEEALALRAWYVTLGDSVVNGTAVPPPQRRHPAERSRLLQCTRQAIVSGQPSAARDALLVLWTGEHLEMLWRLEKHLGRPKEADDPATALQQ
jgi:uncharacterized membrane protein YccC